jgi:hypothetical protein
MSTPSKTQFYLYRAGSMIGPINQERLTSLKASGDLNKYTWIIDADAQKWMPIDAMPQENPFQMTQKVVGNREISGAFLFGNEAFSGTIQGIHSMGLELRMTHVDLRSMKIAPQTVLPLNLIDETNDQTLTTTVIFQGAEIQNEGVLVRLGWKNAALTI